MKNILIQPTRKWALAIIAVAATVYSTVLIYSFLQTRPMSKTASSFIAPANVTQGKTVSARGRIEPEGTVIHLSTSTTFQDARVGNLLVKEGDRVRAEQVIAIMDNHGRLSAALKRAQMQVKVAQAGLAQVLAGSKAGEIAAQRATLARLKSEVQGATATQEATIARLKSELSNADVEHQRYQQLYQERAISASTLDSKRLAVETAQESLREAHANRSRSLNTLRDQIVEAKATLSSVAEIRPTDIQAAQAEVDSAIAAVNQAQADLDLAYVRSPSAGQILKIRTWAGEIVGEEGIADLGQTDQMYVIAEVYETDILQVRLSQPVKITSSTFAGTLHGTVTEIGRQIEQQRVLSTDPVVDVDRRVVEVKIRLTAKDSEQVRDLTNLQVEVFINTGLFHSKTRDYVVEYSAKN